MSIYQNSGGAVNLGRGNGVVWSNHDIPNGSPTSTDIYFEGSAPVPIGGGTEEPNPDVLYVRNPSTGQLELLELGGGDIFYVTPTITGAEIIDGVQTLIGTADKTATEINTAFNDGKGVFLKLMDGNEWLILPLGYCSSEEASFTLYIPAPAQAVNAIINVDGSFSMQFRRAGGSVDAVLYTEQTLTPEQQAQARTNIGITGTGADGYTPVRGTDYWTEADKAEIKAYVDEAILGGAW